MRSLPQCFKLNLSRDCQTAREHPHKNPKTGHIQAIKRNNRAKHSTARGISLSDTGQTASIPNVGLGQETTSQVTSVTMALKTHINQPRAPKYPS